MKRFVKILAMLVVGVATLAAGLVFFSWLRFGPVGLFGHKDISITLPYRMEDEPRGMLPLGEKEEVHPDGHPGIDFQWDYAAPLIATFDGTITNISYETDEGEPVLYVTLNQGEYNSNYKELDSLGPGIAEGAPVSRGDVIGYPHGHASLDGDGRIGYQVHWEFGYASFPGEIRLCPLTYFDPEARVRIETLWEEKIKPRHDNPTGQMICNGEFALP